MPRISIYVSDELKAEIERVKSSVNLSQVFARAIRAAVAKLQKPPPIEKTSMDKLVSRLKSESTRDFEAGWKSGVALANRMASECLQVSDFRRISDGDIRFNGKNRCEIWLIRRFPNPDPCENDAAEDSVYHSWTASFDWTDTDQETWLDGQDAGFTEQVGLIWKEAQEHLGE
ncbi:MAG: hypothetical protein AAFN70_10210 [Planctomycetota bacterium]